MSERLNNISSLATDSMDSLQSGLETAVNVLENSELSRIVDAVDQVYPLPANLKNLSADELAKLGQNRLERYEKELNKGLDKLNKLKDKVDRLFGQVTAVTANDVDSPSLLDIMDKKVRDKPLTWPLSQSKTACTLNLAAGKLACHSPKFKDIYYISATDHFWLAPAAADKKIKLAMREFDTDVFGQKEPEVRNAALSRLGVLDIMMAMVEEAFLVDRDKATWKSLSQRRTDLRNSISMTPDRTVMGDIQTKSGWLRLIEYIVLNEKITTGGMSVSVQHPQQQELEVVESQLKALKKVAAKAAEKKGYYIDSHNDIYDPRQGEIVKAAAAYVEAREMVSGQRYKTIEELKQANQQVQEALAAFVSRSYHVGDAARLSLSNLKEKMALLDAAGKKRVDSIITLSRLGIATPEFAFAGGKERHLTAGQSDFARYYQYLKKAEDLKAQIKTEVNAYMSASGHYVNAPRIFQQYEQAANALEKEADQLRELANKRVAELPTKPLLVWSFDGFKPKKLDVISQPDFPLRELSSAAEAGKQQPLGYLSLRSIAHNVRNSPSTTDYSIGRQDKEGRAEYDLRELNRRDDILAALLEIDGLQKIPLDPAWFDDEGYFNPESLFATLNKMNYEVESLKTSAQQRAWGQHLSQFLFSKRVKALFGPLDESPHAQMLRMVAIAEDGKRRHFTTAAQANLSPTNIEINLKKDRSQMEIMSVAYQAEVNMARGEVTLFNIDLPKEPEPISVLVKSSREEVAPFYLHLGSYLVNLTAKAWGFVGASLKLGRSVQVINQSGDFTISGVDFAKKAVEAGELTAFVGIQAGCRLEGSFHWIPSRPAPAAQKSQAVAPPLDLTQKHRLGAVTISAAAGAGLSRTLPIMLGWNGERLCLYLEPTKLLGPTALNYAISVELGFAAVNRWVDIFLQALRDGKYGRIEIVKDDLSFHELSRMCQLAVTLGVSVGFIAGLGKQAILQLIDSFNRPENGALVAYSMSLKRDDQREETLAHWVRMLPPEALASMFSTLIAGSKEIWIEEIPYSEEAVLVMKQASIANMVRWLNLGHCQAIAAQAQVWQRQFEEAVVQMHFAEIMKAKSVALYKRHQHNPSAIEPESLTALRGEAKQAAYQRGMKEINRFMGLQNDEERSAKLNEQYQKNRDQLVKHLSNTRGMTL